MRLPLEIFRFRGLIGIVAVVCVVSANASTNFSSWLVPGPDGRLLHQADPLGNRLLNYSQVGFKGGGVPIPNVQIKTNISPIAGDNRAHIQSAIDFVSALPLDTNGFRGAVLLSAGQYPVAATLRITASGVVLRGMGSGPTGTILNATASTQYTLVSIGGSGSATNVGGTTHDITNRYVPVGARSFQVDSTSGLAVGDRVYVRRVATSEWIHDLGMDLLCCPPGVNPWTPGGYHIDADRLITRIEANRIFIDAPLTTAIDRAYTNGTIRKFTWSGRIQNSAIESLRGVSSFTNSTDENHAWIFVQFSKIEHGWARDVVSQSFGYACVALAGGAKWVTVRDCQSLDPVSQVTGGRRYAFVLDDCCLCLVQNCYNRDDRHQFVTQSLTTGPNVFVDGRSDSARSDCGPHHRWGSGAIWDNVTVNGNNLNIQNRGNSGSGHGWAGANEVAWNCDADGGFVVQNPPTARNWLIGSVGAIENGTGYVGPHDPGTYDSHGSNVFPNSLYYAQLQDRLAAPGLQTREYWLGEIGRFTNSSPGGDVVPVDSSWRATVQSAAGGAPLDNFDLVSVNHWVPFSFSFNLAPDEYVVGASLAISMLSSGNSASNDLLYLDSLTNGVSLASLGWLPISTSVSNPTVRTLNLSSQLGLLADGKLNLALQNGLGVDWALLQLEVAPRVGAGTVALLPVADATVRGGVNANANFGTATTLSVKEDSLADNDRKTFLRWDLGSITGLVYHARVRLTPVSVGTNAIEQSVLICTNDLWSEAGITWNNQPAIGSKRFATWIPGTNGPLEFVVTPDVLDALAGDKQLSLQVASLRDVGAQGLVDYGSRESADVNLRPQLLLLVSELPPTISDLTNVSIAVNSSTGPIPFTVGDDKSAAAALSLSGTSSNTNLVPNANILFGGSGSNRTVSVTPAPNQSGLANLTVTVTDTAGLSSSDSFAVTVSSHPPGIFVWNGPGAGANPWSLGANWSPVGPPEALDDVKFYDLGAIGVAGSNINNVVDAAAGNTVASLHYANTNGNHTTLISPGRALVVQGLNGLTVGTGTDNGNTQAVQTIITGPGSALHLQGGNLIVRQGTDAASSSAQRASLNLSDLDLASANIDRVIVGSEGPFARVTGTLFMARTNRITAAGSAPAIAIGGLAGGNGNGGGASFLYLGRSNAVFANSLAIGRGKQGGSPSSLRFNPAFTNANPALGAFAYFRAADGLDRIATWTIADSGSIAGTVNTAGACDFSGGMVDAKVGTMVIGKTSSGEGNGNPVGTLTLSAGALDINTLQLAYQSIAGTNSATGTANVNGGALLVNNTLELGVISGGAGEPTNVATLSINGGSVFANSLKIGHGGKSSLLINNGTLTVTNPLNNLLDPLGRFALTNASVQLPANTNVVTLVVSNLVTGVGVNTLHLGSYPALANYPAQFKLIQYSGPIAGAGFNFVLGALPDAAVCGGYLSNNAAANSIDLVLTNCGVPDPFLTWDGSLDGDWDTQSANWKNNLSSGLTYSDGDAVLFNDSAGGATNINLTQTLTPAAVTVSNAFKTFAFIDFGKLSGAGSLIKHGPGTLIIANEEPNDFSGGLQILGGSLRVGDGGTNGMIPPGTVVNHGALIFHRNDDFNVANAISGTGTLTKTGAGMLQLDGASTFSGATIIAQGTLRAGNAAMLGNTTGGTTIGNGATLDVNGVNLGLEPILVSGAGINGNGAIINQSGNPSFLNPNLAYVTLGGNTTFGGTGRWDLRSASTTSTNAALSTGSQPFKLTKVGTNQVSLVAVAVDPALGDIEVQAGILSVEKVTSSLGNPAFTLSVSNGASLQFYQVSNVLNKVLLLKNGATVLNNSGANTFGGPVTLQGTNTFNAGGAWLKFTNLLSGSGSLVKTGNSTLFLSAVNTYLGNTLVNAGILALTNSGSIPASSNISLAAGATLDVSGTPQGKLTLFNGQTLSGNGTVNGGLLVNSGATLSPGASIGALTISNALTLQGITWIELSKSPLTNDVVRGLLSVSYGGTLNLAFTPGALAANDSFRLFYAGISSGAFTNITPPVPGAGLAWDTSLLLSSGTLRIVAAPTRPTIDNLVLSGFELVMAGSGGPPGGTYYVLSSTNLGLPLANWTRVATNAFSGAGTFNFTHAVDANSAQRFFLLQVP